MINEEGLTQTGTSEGLSEMRVLVTEGMISSGKIMQDGGQCPPPVLLPLRKDSS